MCTMTMTMVVDGLPSVEVAPACLLASQTSRPAHTEPLFSCVHPLADTAGDPGHLPRTTANPPPPPALLCPPLSLQPPLLSSCLPALPPLLPGVRRRKFGCGSSQAVALFWKRACEGGALCYRPVQCSTSRYRTRCA